MNRLDTELTARGLAETRSRAQASIAAGNVTVNGVVCLKPAQKVSEEDEIRVTAPLPYVGRGGFKLAFALSQFRIRLAGLHCLDVGASTGGFTDCMLQNGVASVLAVDVGHGQMAEQLRQDPRVTLLEGTDIRTLSPETEGLPADFLACDVSFISLKQILPACFSLLREGGTAVVLVKPQFEAGRNAANKQGVVRDPKIHARVLREIRDAAALCGFVPVSDCESPILGGSGNKEFLLCLERRKSP